MKNLIGLRFSKLVVLSKTERRLRGNIIWLCSCDCGQTTYVSGNRLLSGNTKSCGCHRKEVASSMFRGKSPVTKKEYRPDAAINDLFIHYKANAKKRNILFEIDLACFNEITSSLCDYCGSPPLNKHSTKSDSVYFYNGIDRVDNNKGYTLENVVSCCKRCNTAKLDQTELDFLNHIRKIYEYSIRKKENELWEF